VSLDGTNLPSDDEHRRLSGALPSEKPTPSASMTREEFDGRYPAVRRLTHEGVITYEARDTAGRRVFTHFLGPVSDHEVDRLVGLVDRLPEADRAKVLHRLDVEGMRVLVTSVLEPFSGLAPWLETRASAEAPRPGAEDREVLSAFTSLFGEPVRPGAAPPGGVGKKVPETRASVPPPPAPEPLPVPEPPARVPATPAAPPTEPAAPTTPPPPAAPSTPAGPGEFTRLFGAERGPPPAQEPPARVPATPAPPPTEPAVPTTPTPAAPPQPAGPGEFTRLFGAEQGQAPPAPGAPPAPEPTAREPATPAPPPTEPAAPTTRLPPAAPSEPAGPGEFTRLFGAEGGPPPAPEPPAWEPAAPPPTMPGEAGDYRDRLRGAGKPAPGTRPPATPPTEPAAPPQTPSEPGEFTRLFGKEGDEAPPQARPPTPGPTPPPASPGSSGDYRDRLQGAGGPTPPTPLSSAPAPDLPSGPGAYTRIVSATPSQPAGTPPAPGQGEAAAPPTGKGRRGRDYVVLGAVLFVVVVSAIALIAIALTSGGGATP
jgi:hypothetical protein